jgi:RNAse (barnase) inhibitor barstar
LSNLPPHAVLPLTAYGIDGLRRDAQRTDQTLLEIDLADARGRDEVFARIGTAMNLPAHFGGNLDALYDCITDLKPDDSAEQPGFVVVLSNIPEREDFDAAARDALLDVFR